jgi:hypothetical protein
MNPLPLRSEAGVVFAYACGHCYNVQGGSHRYTLEPPDAAHLEHMRLDAEQCCRCRYCQKQLPDDRGLLSGACEPCQATHDAAEEARWEAGREEREASQRRQREMVLASVALAKNEDAAWRIMSMIRSISEEYYAAGWLCGIEYELWEALVETDRRQFGVGELPESDADQLRALSERAGGWWVWQDGVGEIFVTAKNWTEHLYPAWVKQQEHQVEDAPL